MSNPSRGVMLWAALAAGAAGAQALNPDPYRRPAPTPFSYPEARKAKGALPRPSSWASLAELQPDTGTQTPEDLMEGLVQEEPAQRLESLIRLLPWANSLLPQLDQRVGLTRDETDRDRLRVALREMTRHWVPLPRLAAHPHLKALADADVERGRQLVEPWTKVTTTDDLVVVRKPIGWCGNEPRQPTTLRPKGGLFAQLRNELALLGGFARPAVEDLLKSSTAEAKLHGFALAQLLDVHPSRELLRRLQQDPYQDEVSSYRLAVPSTWQSTWGGPETISERARQLQGQASHLHASPAPGTPPSARDAAKRTAEVLNGMPRPGGEKKDAPSRFELLNALNSALSQLKSYDGDEQLYWNRMRPLWRSWWGMGGLWATPDEQQRWFHAVNGISGVQHDTVPRKDTQYELRIEEPVGARIRIDYQPEHGDKVLSKEGRVPFQWIIPGGFPRVNLWLDEEWKDVVVFVFSPGETRHVWLQPELIRYPLE